MSDPSSANTLSERIAALRRRHGLTQEQLGQQMGVSAQAVSKWEKGGAPDILLLPGLAAQLGVTVDALFGQESAAPAGQNLPELVRQSIAALPEGERMEAVCRFVWQILPVFSDYLQGLLPAGQEGFPSAFLTTAEGERLCLRSLISLPEGFAFGIRAADLSFVSVWPEPAGGYDLLLAENDAYRALFACLAQPGCLELLRWLLSSEKQRWFVPAVAARETGLALPQAEAALAALCKQNFLARLDLTLESGPVAAYALQNNAALLPTLCLARYLLGNSDVYAICWDTLQEPLLRGQQGRKPPVDEEKEPTP